jgi:hypothetical protein
MNCGPVRNKKYNNHVDMYDVSGIRVIQVYVELCGK